MGLGCVLHEVTWRKKRLSAHSIALDPPKRSRLLQYWYKQDWQMLCSPYCSQLSTTMSNICYKRLSFKNIFWLLISVNSMGTEFLESGVYVDTHISKKVNCFISVSSIIKCARKATNEQFQKWHFSQRRIEHFQNGMRSLYLILVKL